MKNLFFLGVKKGGKETKNEAESSYMELWNVKGPREVCLKRILLISGHIARSIYFNVELLIISINVDLGVSVGEKKKLLKLH